MVPAGIIRPTAVPIEPAPRLRWRDRSLLLLLILIIGLTHGIALWHSSPLWSTPQPGGYYAHLTDAFLAGQTHLKIVPHPALAAMENPYAGNQGIPRLHDATYYQNRYYLYFGTPPVFLLYAPWRLLTGSYLTDGVGTAVFAFAGFLIGTWLLCRLRQWYFPHAPPRWLLMAVVLWGWGSYTQPLVYYGSVYPVPIACAFACITLAFTFLASAIRAPRCLRWSIGAGAAWGLAVACRPNYLFTLLALVPAAICLLWANQLQPPDARRKPWQILAALGAPILLTGMLLSGYNWIRFHNILEYGTTYMFASSDQQHMAMLALKNLPAGISKLLFSSANYSPYFPFIDPTDAIWGVITFSPVAILALGLPLMLVWRRRVPAPWQVAGLVPLIVGLVNLTTISLLPTQTDRYIVDFLPMLVLLACGLILALAHAGPIQGRKIALLATGLLAAWTLVHSLGLNFHLLQHQKHGAALARWLNWPAFWAESALGTKSGPVRLRLKLPSAEPGSSWPLLVTGAGRDVLYLRYVTKDTISVGFFHTGDGGPVSEPVQVDLNREHVLELDLGALYPPADHPLLASLPATDVATLKRRVRVKLDDRVLLDRAARFYPTAPRDLFIAENPGDLITGSNTLRPQLLSSERLGIEAGLAAMNPMQLSPLRLRLKFPPFVSFKTEPLVSTGHPGAGDLFYVSYLGPNQLRFGHDSWEGGAWETSTVTYDPGAEHELEVNLGSLQPLRPDRSSPGPLQIRFDGTLLGATTRPFHPTEPGAVVLGFNGMGSSSASAIFTGTIIHHENIPALVLSPSEGFAYGKLRLSVRFPQGRNGHHEPLLTSGQPGAGDFIYVIYHADSTIRIGYDHWNFGGPVSKPIRINHDSTYMLEISSGVLFPPADSAAWKDVGLEEREQALSTILVTLDGTTVLSHSAENYPAEPSSVEIGQNNIGGSTCETTFTGHIFSRESGGLPAPGKRP